MRADNNGEGGTLALLALAQRAVGHRTAVILSCSASLGAALFYGDAAITPAISVLSAVEGLEARRRRASTPTSSRSPSAILVALFCVQSRGTASVGRCSGRSRWSGSWCSPCSASCTSRDGPAILSALNPRTRVGFLARPRLRRARSCSARSSSRSPAPRRSTPTWATSAAGRSALAWLGARLPGLALNYLGQGALVLGRPEAAENPFFLMAPRAGPAAAGAASRRRRRSSPARR